MANVDIISVKIVDENGKSGNCVYYIPTGQALADILLQAQAFMTVLDAITGGVIQEANVTLGLTLPGGLKSTATASHDINKGANIGFDVANTPYRTNIRVPAIAESIVTGEEVNITSGAGLAFVSQVISGVSPVLPSDKYGNDVVAALEGVVTFWKS